MDIIKKLELIKSQSTPGKKPHLKLLSDVISVDALLRIEQSEKINLPEEYKEILTQIGIISLSGNNSNIVFNSLELLNRAPYDLFDKDMIGVLL